LGAEDSGIYDFRLTIIDFISFAALICVHPRLKKLNKQIQFAEGLNCVILVPAMVCGDISELGR